MNSFFSVLKFLSIGLLLIGTASYGADQSLPVIDGKKAVATVNDEPIFLDELNKSIGASHAAKLETKKAGHIDFSAIMNRLINSRLITIEARNMGFAELPEIKDLVDTYSQQVLVEILLERHVEDIKADAAEIEKLYKEKTKEWKIKAVRFKKEEDVKIFNSALQKDNFDEMVKKAIEEGIAEADKKGEYLKDKELTAPVAQLVSKMEVGSISPVISLDQKRGFIIFRLDGVRQSEKEDPEARKYAENQALNLKKVQAANDYYQELKKKYVKIDSKLFEELDFESKDPGFEKLLEDKRIIAGIKGEDPFTVGNLAKELKEKFFHGIERAIEARKVNKKKVEILEATLQKKVLRIEALKQGVDKSDSYIERVRNYENSVIFGMFIKKVIVPDIKLEPKELKAYYDENKEMYTNPRMMRIKSLVFGSRNNAENAFDKLIKGTDYNWLSSHAEGQLDKNTKGLIKFDSKLLTLNGLPEDVRKVVSGADSGSFRLYSNSTGHHYVLYIFEVISPDPSPYESVKKKITEEVFSHKVTDAIEDWGNQLKEQYPVTIFREDLKK